MAIGSIAWAALFLLGTFAILHTPWSQGPGAESTRPAYAPIRGNSPVRSLAALTRPSMLDEGDVSLATGSPVIQQVGFESPVAPASSGPPPISTRQTNGVRVKSSAMDGTRYPLDPDWKKEVAQLSAEDRVVLASLPPMCTSELPGVDLAGQPSQVMLATIESSSVAMASVSPPPKENVAPSSSHSISTVSTAGGARPLRVSTEMRSSSQSFLESQLESQTAASATPPGGERFAVLPNPPTRASVASLGASPHPSAHPKSKAQPNSSGPDPHLEIYSRDAFPSAKQCATCHKQIYEEWAGSSHAYAVASPMFHAFEDTINRLSQGTIGYFCLRCHAPVATTMGLRRDQPIWDGPRVFREGITCVVCHRVKTAYTKSNGERRIEPGDIYQPIYGATSGVGADIANKYSQFFKLKTDPHDTAPGQPIHKRAIQFEEIAESTFCVSCHQVAVKPGVKLEVVWDQYRASPAYREGVTCQDCHTGKVPGVAAGYSVGPAAVVNDKVVNSERKHSNHSFYGPGYSIAHPGIFPDNLEADRWKFNQWLEFDWRAGWGTDAFEDALGDGEIESYFPEAWREVDDRYDAREIVDANLKKLEYKKDIRRQLFENASKLDGPFFAHTPNRNSNLDFKYCLTNTNPGHNMPSGSLGAQPQLWMNVVLVGPGGDRIWESGYVDSSGDCADRHSLDVLAGKIPLDTQLLNLQTRFLTTNVKGTDREMYLPVNFDVDQLPFLRPASQPVTVINHPPGIRMEAHSIPPLGSRNVKYSVPARLLQQPGVYRLSVRMRSRAEPIYFMRFCGATPEMIRSMNEWIVDFHQSTVTFEVR